MSSEAAPSDTPFVGRTRELRLIGHLLDSSAAGSGQALAITGSAGIGKTRLLHQISAAAAQRGIAVRHGRCLEEPGAPPYWPWRQMLRAQWQAMAAADRAALPAQQLQWLAALLPGIARRPAAASTADDPQHRWAVYDAVAGFWAAACARQPLLILIDNVHDADAGSLKLIEFVVAEMAGLPLALALTSRDDEAGTADALHATWAELARAPHFRRLRLRSLSAGETAEFVARSGAADARLAESLHRHTEGHPLFLVETVRLLAQEGRLAQFDDEGPPAPLGIPDSVRELIGKRLQRLQPAAARALATAACVGRGFDVELLQTLMIDTSDAALDDALHEAAAARLIEPLPHAAGYRFTHALVREVLYERLAPARRVSPHARIGAWLERRPATADEVTRLVQLAHHFAQAAAAGGEAAKARDYAEQAALRAAEAYAFEDAAQLLRRALALHDPGATAARLRLLLKLGEVELALGKGAAAAAAYRQAATLADDATHAAAFCSAAIGYERACVVQADAGDHVVALLQRASVRASALDPGLRSQVEAGLCRALLYGGCVPLAEAAWQRAVALAQPLPGPQALYAALASFGSAVFDPALLPLALERSLQAWHLLDRAGCAAEASPENDAYLLFGLLRRGDTARAERLSRRMLEWVRQRRSMYHEALLHCAAVQLALGRGEFARAEAAALQAFEAARRVDAPQASSAFGLQMFAIRREQGRLAEAAPLLQQLLQDQPAGSFWAPGLALLQAELGQMDACRSTYRAMACRVPDRLRGDAQNQTLLAFTAEACVALGDAADAARLLALLRPLAGSCFVADLAGPGLGSADRLLGTLASVCRRWDDAERHLHDAIAQDARAQAPLWRAHSRYRLALMLAERRAAGDDARAVELLRLAHDDAATLGMAALQARAARRLAQLESAAPQLSGLSARELEVLQLVCLGRNNRDIAQVLAISPNTVANHMRSIFEKTYTANRTEAAAFARSQGIA